MEESQARVDTHRKAKSGPFLTGRGGCICDLTLFPGQFSPTMSFPITPRNIESFPNCKDHTQWFSSSAAEVSAPKDRRHAEGLVQLHSELEVGYCRLVTISTDNITETNEYRSGVGAQLAFPF